MPSPIKLLPTFPYGTCPDNSVDCTQQLCLQNVLALLVLLRGLVRLVVLPTHRLFALPADNIPHYMSPRGHVALNGFSLRDIYDGVEQVGFAMLAAEVLGGEA